MKKTIKTLIIFLVLVILGINSQVYAASTTFKPNNNTVNVGDEITVTATVTAAQWDLKIKLNGKTLAESSELENYESNITKTITAKYKTTEKGKLDFVLEGDITDVNQENKTINDKVSVTVNEKQAETKPPVNETPETETPTQKPEETPKSSEVRLKNFGIKPIEYDFSGFSKNPDKEEWSAEVPNRVTSVEVYAEPKDNKAKVSGDGKVTLNEGNNKIGVKVTAEDGKTKTYTLTIKRKTVAEEEAENGENRLKSLSIKPKEYDFTGFDSETTEYTAEVPNEVEQIEISATAMDSKAQITGTGIIDLEEGENELKVEVIAVNGDKKTYTLTVTRKEAEAKEAFGLTTLSINGLKLTPSFKTDIYEYTAELEEDLTALEITTKATSEDATVEIVGNENLQDGENVITILVENEETEEVATYQITVNKLVVAEIVEKTSCLKPSTWGKEEIIKIIIIVVLIILIICAVILKKNISKESPKSKKMDLPGAEELDKAIAEHQELVDSDTETVVEEMDITENVNQTHEEHNYIEEIAKNKFEVEDFDDKPKRRGRHF